MQIMNGPHSGQDDRSNAWLFTCDRWMDYDDTCIQLPINPTSWEVSNPVRGSSGETQQGRFMYVFRNPKSKSLIKPCNYSFEIPSGCIVPEFSTEYVKQVQEAVFDYGRMVMSSRPGTVPNADAALDGHYDADGNENVYYASRANQRTVESMSSAVRLDSYRAGQKAQIENTFDSQTAYPYNVADHLAGKSFRKHSEGLSPKRTGIMENIPPLYRSDIPITLQNIWAFMALMQEPLTFVDSNDIVRNNRIIVHLSTLVTPSLTMYGWPDSGGLKLAESASETPEITLNFDLFITGSSPAFGYTNFDAFASSYKANISTPTTSLDRLRYQLTNDAKAHSDNHLAMVKRK
jgi:hypothetical protein